MSLERQIESRFREQDCVLEKLPEDVAKLVVKQIVEQSLPHHIHEHTNTDLNTEKEVRWMMEVSVKFKMVCDTCILPVELVCFL